MTTRDHPLRPASRAGTIEAAYHAERRRLFALAYRMTGSHADADDVVQEAFARLSTLDPAGFPDTPAAWLWRATTNLAIDAIRRRRRRRYVGPWLPTPLFGSDSGGAEELADPGPDAASRYELEESATYAFLLALEALGPRQRAVVLLRDVFGHSASETGTLLGISEGNARILHLRARRALATYDLDRCRPSLALRERHREALGRFLACLATGDSRGLEDLLCEDVQTLTDAGGEYTAVARPLVGRAPVARLYLVAAEHRRAGGTREEWLEVNGLPAVRITLLHPVRRQAPTSILRCDLDARGRIRAIHAILASQKLARLAPPLPDPLA
jgi:RNA polymerase sigma-70 factor, ECF subfamily